MKINISFTAQDASLRRDAEGNLIVMAEGIDEGQWNDAPAKFKAQLEANRKEAEREAKIQAELRKQAEAVVDGKVG